MLDFLLKIHPTILVVTISILISVIMVIVYKYMTDQNLMKQLKDEIKELQTEMKTLKDNPAKMSEINKKAMETNMKYMMHSLKPTLVTFIPIILIFGWLNANIAYEPLTVGEEFNVQLQFYDEITGDITPITPEGIELISNETYTITDNIVRLVYKPMQVGEYTLQYKLNNNVWENTIVVTDGQRDYTGPMFQIKDKTLKTITVSNEKFKPLGELNIFGWQPGWVALYIIISLVCSLSLRKLLKVY
ncbi:MAG: EMC3/TMCO1 family protein [Candidatus Woesearchaeota archaeon]|jgi:uncharacterized membrane protein (DUF106 family)